LEKSKNDFENLEKHCKNSSHVCDSLVCENCENHEKKVHYLVRTVDKLSKGKSTLRMSWHLKIVFLEELDLVSIHRTSKISFQSLFQNC